MTTIAIVDYGMGNLGSVENAFRFLEIPVLVSGDSEALRRADALVVPGVGAFGDCMDHLSGHGLDRLIKEHIRAEKPFLGICLGLQILFERSEESADTPGLGVFKGSVVHFPTASEGGPRKIPHMGWNSLNLVAGHPVLEEIPDQSYVYFVHSYFVQPADAVAVARTEYGPSFVAAVARRNLFACQFHPEKSQSVGLRMLSNFSRMARDESALEVAR